MDRQEKILLASFGGLTVVGGGIVVYELWKSRHPGPVGGIQVVRVIHPQGQNLPCGRKNLTVTVRNVGSTPAYAAVEAVIVNAATQTVVGPWYSTTHPQGAAPEGSQDNPAWTQMRALLQPGQQVDFMLSMWVPVGTGEPITSIVYYANLPAGYTGPLVTPKTYGTPVFALRPVAPNVGTYQVPQQFTVIPGSNCPLP